MLLYFGTGSKESSLIRRYSVSVSHAPPPRRGMVHADGVKFPRTKPLHVSKSHVICFFFVLVKATSLVQHCLRPICHVFLCHLSRHEVFVSFLVKWIVWSISFLTSTWRNTRPNHPLRLARVRTFLTAYRRAPTYKCEVSNRSAPSDSSWQ